MNNIEAIRFAYAMIKDWSNELKDKDYFECIINNNDLMAIENLLKENQANKEKIKELEAVNKMQEYRINEMDIPKSKVREKIEYIQKNYSEHSEFPIGKSIEFLEELLQEGDK